MKVSRQSTFCNGVDSRQLRIDYKGINMISKYDLREISINGYKFSCYNKGLYYFQKEERDTLGRYTGMYFEICMKGEDICNGNIIDMMMHDMTYVEC